jgi:hypothetical protein
MATLQSIRNALDYKIWNTGIARTLNVYNVTSSTVDDRDQEFLVYETTPTSTKAVPYNTLAFVQEPFEWGSPDSQETDMAFRYDAPINKNSMIVDTSLLEGSYKVRAIEKYPFGDGFVAVIARLTKQL